MAVCGTATSPADVAPVLRAAGRLDRCLDLAPPGAAERAALLAARLRERGASYGDDDIQVRRPELLLSSGHLPAHSYTV